VFCVIATWNHTAVRRSDACSVLGKKDLEKLKGSMARVRIVGCLHGSRRITSYPSREVDREAQTTLCLSVDGVTRTRGLYYYTSGCRRFQSTCHNTIMLIHYSIFERKYFLSLPINRKYFFLKYNDMLEKILFLKTEKPENTFFKIQRYTSVFLAIIIIIIR
jgi:hypothetical protein